LVPGRLAVLAVALDEPREGVAHSRGGGGDDRVEAQPLASRPASHQRGGPFAPAIQWAVEVAKRRVAPVRLGMSQQSDRLHLSSSILAPGMFAFDPSPD